MAALEAFLPVMEQVYSMAYRKQILGENVPNPEKMQELWLS